MAKEDGSQPQVISLVCAVLKIPHCIHAAAFHV